MKHIKSYDLLNESDIADPFGEEAEGGVPYNEDDDIVGLDGDEELYITIESGFVDTSEFEKYQTKFSNIMSDMEDDFYKWYENNYGEGDVDGLALDGIFNNIILSAVGMRQPD